MDTSCVAPVDRWAAVPVGGALCFSQPISWTPKGTKAATSAITAVITNDNNISENWGNGFLRNWEYFLYHLAAFSSETERPDFYGRRQGRKYWDSDVVAILMVLSSREFKVEQDRLEQHILFLYLHPPSVEQPSNVLYVSLSF